jgi:hypothetical protein
MAKRRTAAFGVDYLIIAAWIGLITAIGFGARALLGIESGVERCAYETGSPTFGSVVMWPG